jgi:chemotaxis protein methyltransferase CheR
MSAPNPAQIDDADFQLVREVVYQHCGISLNEDKRALVQARISRQMRIAGIHSVKEYLHGVLSNRAGRVFAEFIDAISTNLTSFFRESEHYQFLLQHELPQLLARKRAAGESRILVWSAACSSGEEPYSLTMTILQAIERVAHGPARWDVRVLATDISTKMLAAARAGIYEQSRLNTVPADYRSRYFSDAGDGQNAVVSQELRNIVRFRHLNLMDPWPFKGPFDVIFCRNVMIYFDKETQRRLVERFWSVLGTQGWLFTGHSESLTGVVHRFVNRRPSIYQKAA